MRNWNRVCEKNIEKRIFEGEILWLMRFSVKLRVTENLVQGMMAWNMERRSKLIQRLFCIARTNRHLNGLDRSEWNLFMQIIRCSNKWLYVLSPLCWILEPLSLSLFSILYHLIIIFSSSPSFLKSSNVTPWER